MGGSRARAGEMGTALGHVFGIRASLSRLVGPFVATTRPATALISAAGAEPQDASGRPGHRPPRTQAEVEQVRAQGAPGWEYHYFAGVLYVGKQLLEGKYLDHQLGHADPTGERAGDADALRVLAQNLGDARVRVRALNMVMSPEAQQQAFGPPGVPGNADLIERLALRMNSFYAALLDASARLRGMDHSERFDRLFELEAKLTDQPIEQYRRFVDELVAQVDRAQALPPGSQPIALTMTLTLSIPDVQSDEVTAELNRLAGEVS